MIDIIAYLAIFVLCFVLSFCGCFQCASCFPLLCSGECICCQQCKASKVEGEVPMTKIPSGEADAEEAGLKGSSTPHSCQQELPKKLSDPLVWAARVPCAAVVGFIVTIIVLASYETTFNPYPSTPASDCQASCPTSMKEWDRCCSYHSTLLPIQEVTFSSDGNDISGFWIPAGPNGAVSNTTLLYYHGSARNIAVYYRQLRYVNWTTQLGVNVFAIDYPGYGKSSGKTTEDGVYQAARDALTWLDTNKGIKPKDILLLGRSMGSAPAVKMAVEVEEKGQQFKGLVLDSGFRSYKDAAEAYVSPMFGWLIKAGWPVVMDNIGIIDKTKACLFLYHSKDDEIVPYFHAEDLFLKSASPASCKKFLDAEGFLHGDWTPKHVQEALVTWFQALP